jgi:hypothetical protein
VKKYFSIFLILIVALSSVGMSVSQHFCTMSKEEIEAKSCKMCASKNHGKDEAGKSDKKSCCSDKSVHLRLDADATSAKTLQAPQPLISALPFALLLHAEVPTVLVGPNWTADQALPSFPLAEKHTVLRV